jgi:hypothetical protein
LAEFATVATGFPAVLWTAALALSVVFWLTTTFLAGTDLDLDAEVDGGGPLAGVVEALGLGHAPASVVFTLLSAIGWLVTMLASAAIGSPSLPIGLVVLVGSLVVATPITARLARLIGPLYAANAGIDRDHLVGRTCTVRTGRVDQGFGQAEVLDADGASHLIHVRCAAPNELTAGSKALVVSVEDNVFLVDPDLPWADDD